MSNPADGIKELLENAGVGVFAATSGWSIQISRERDTPNTMITIFNTGGETPLPHLRVDYPGVQVQVRGDKNGYQAARAKAQEVKDALLGISGDTVNGDVWPSIRMIGDIIDVGYDENERPIISVNFDLIIEPSSGTHRDPL